MRELQQIFEAARSHPFYGEALRGVARFEDCPVLEKPALYEAVRRALEDPAFRRGTYFSPSGGTTSGRPLYFPTDIRENKRQRRLLARRLKVAGLLGDTTIALNLFPGTRMYRALEIFNDYCELCGATVLPVGAQAPDEEAWAAAEQFGATLVLGMPSRLLAFARWLTERGRTLRVESVLFAGELLHPRKRRLLERAFGVSRFGGVYGSAEMGVVAYQPDVGEPPVYRFPRELIHVEVGEPDGDGFGRLIVTNLVRTRHPLLRYNTGDVGRLVTETADEVCVELRGRESDSFAVGPEYFHLREFAAVLDRFAQSQVVIAFDGAARRDRVTFRLVADEPVPPERQQDVTASLRRLLGADDRAYLTEVAFVPPEALLRHPRTLKVPTVVDLREREDRS
jgi:phenylacetate-CoA ligase